MAVYNLPLTPFTPQTASGVKYTKDCRKSRKKRVFTESTKKIALFWLE